MILPVAGHDKPGLSCVSADQARLGGSPDWTRTGNPSIARCGQPPQTARNPGRKPPTLGVLVGCRAPCKSTDAVSAEAVEGGADAHLNRLLLLMGKIHWIGAGILSNIGSNSKERELHKAWIGLEFVDMHIGLVENESKNLDGVEIVTTAPEGLVVGEELISE